MTSQVSVVSDFVANGHQIVPYDSCSPSKIPYVGFSPVRLQTEVPPRPSLVDLEIKRKTHIPSVPTRLYAAIGHLVLSWSPVSPGIAWWSLPSRGPWLSDELCCLTRSSLTMASSETLGTFRRLISFSPRRVFAPRSGESGYREAPQFTPRVSLPVPSSVPRQIEWLLATVPSPPILASPSSAWARHLLSPPPRRFSGGLCNEAATFAWLRRGELLALHRQELLLSSFHLPGSPPGSVEYNYPAKQSIAGAGLTPARHAALWAANRGHRVYKL